MAGRVQLEKEEWSVVLVDLGKWAAATIAGNLTQKGG